MIRRNLNSKPIYISTYRISDFPVSLIGLFVFAIKKMIEAASCKAIGLPNPLVSVILPIYNAEEWLDSCLQSIVDQTYCGLMELCIYDDACTDSSMLKVKKYADQLMKRGIQLNISQCNEGDQRKPKGILYCS